MLDTLASEPGTASRVAHHEVLASRPARTATPAIPLHPEVDGRLRSRGVGDLWVHQVEAIDRLRAGHNVVIATGTASGKSLCYQIPILESVLAQQRETALLVFPTKALAQDQLRSLRSWLVPGMRAVTYDGDTTADERAWARRNANVVLTNPEMLHVGILPAHRRWSTFLMRLRLVVVDELHTMRGIFGSHVAHVLRRLRRVLAHYGAAPSFCFSSATIGNPAELASSLLGMPVDTVHDDGSPRSERCLVVWQRPFLDEVTGTRASANVETATLLARLVRDGRPTLAFTRSRKAAELVAAHAQRLLAREPELAERVAAYRAGYRPEERRRLLDGDAHRRARRLAARTGLDADAIWAWGVVERVSTGLLCTRVGLQPVGRQMLAVADHLARRAPRGTR